MTEELKIYEKQKLGSIEKRELAEKGFTGRQIRLLAMQRSRQIWPGLLTR